MPFPSAEQKKIIDHRNSPLIVVAGPGTGKTKTLVERMISLLREDSSRNISFITFTRTSRRDTQRKIEEEFGSDSTGGNSLVVPRVGTLHANAKSIVHKYASLIGRRTGFTILLDSKGERDLLIREVIDDLEIDTEVSQLRDAISRFRCTCQWPDGLELSTDKRQQALTLFDRLLDFYNTFDFDGIVVAACKLVDDAGIEIPPLFLQVDEFQDLNPADQRLVHLISSREGSQVVVVGDDSQSIYGFRHANYRGLHDLWADDSWVNINLSECFRLPPEILNAALALIARKEYLGSSLLRKHPNSGVITTYQCTSAQFQDVVIARRILQLKGELSNEEGGRLKYKDFMVLSPSGKFIPGIVATLQDDYGIPAKEIKRPIVPDEAWRVLLVLRMAQYSDDLALRHWLELMEFDPVFITTIRRDAMASKVTLHQQCESIGDHRLEALFASVECVRSCVPSVDGLAEALSAVPNIDTGKNELGRLLREIYGENGDPPSLVTWMRLINESYGVLDVESEVPEDDSVLVTTLHSAKGLEAECVFISWMNADYMPMVGRDAEEERRVLYVGMTRAKQVLGFAFHEKYDPQRRRRLREEAMSPFLRDIVDHLTIERVDAASLH